MQPKGADIFRPFLLPISAEGFSAAQKVELKKQLSDILELVQGKNHILGSSNRHRRTKTIRHSTHNQRNDAIQSGPLFLEQDHSVGWQWATAMKRFYFSSLRIHLILLVLIAVLPAWGLMLYTDVKQKEQSVAEVQNNLYRLAALASHEEQRLIDNTRQILATLAQVVRYDCGDPVRGKTFFTRLLQQYPHYANFGVITLEGDLSFSATPLSSPMNVGGRSWFNRAVENRSTAIGYDTTGSITGKPAFIFAYPAVNEAGQVIAVVFAALDPGQLNRLKFDIVKQLPQTATMTVINNQGVILTRQPKSEKGVVQPLPDNHLIKTVLEQKRGSLETTDGGGREWFYTFTPLPSALNDSDYYLIFGIPKKVLFAHSSQLLLLNLMGLGVVVVLALLVAWVGGDLFILRRVRALAIASRQLRDGNWNARTGAPYGRDELSQLAYNFDEMAATLKQQADDRKQTAEKIKLSHEQLRNLSAHLQTVREEERTRIAREIHDDLGQVLTALKMDLSWLRKRSPNQQDAIFGKIESMSLLIDQTIENVHTLSAELRPGILDDLGLLAAIEWQAEEFQNRTEIECRVATDSQDVALEKGQATTVFRIFQEAMTNVVRHAEATKIDVILKENNGTVTLTVEDNGRGITAEESFDSKSFGLIGMRERVRPWGGEISITGVHGRGTRLTAKIPLEKKENQYDPDNNS